MAESTNHPHKPVDESPVPDAHLAASMNWVMPVWLVCFIVVVLAGIVSYLVGWWLPRG